MAGPISIDSVVTLLQAGTYPITVGPINWFSREQQDKRRKYPSIEVVEVKNASTTETQKDETRQRVFQVRIYQRLAGADMDQARSDQESMEKTVFGILDGLVLEDHKIVVNDKQWSTTYQQQTFPHFIKSVITVSTQVKNVAVSTDGLLTFVTSGSSVDNPPSNPTYIYTQCFNTTFDEGYGTIEEPITSNPNGTLIPVYFPGRFSAPFVTSIFVAVNDLGSTGEKLNQLNRIRTNGQKPLARLFYNDKTAALSPNNINMDYTVLIDKISYLYQTQDEVVFRVTGRLIKPSSMTTS